MCLCQSVNDPDHLLPSYSYVWLLLVEKKKNKTSVLFNRIYFLGVWYLEEIINTQYIYIRLGAKNNTKFV